jgi:hypothetical protein
MVIFALGQKLRIGHNEQAKKDQRSLLEHIVSVSSNYGTLVYFRISTSSDLVSVSSSRLSSPRGTTSTV